MSKLQLESSRLTLREFILSLAVILFPPTLWLLITQDFYLRKFIEYIGFIFQFAAYMFLAFFPLNLPISVQNGPLVSVVNLIPIAFLGPVIYVVLTKVFKKKGFRAIWISLVGSIFVVEMLGLGAMYLFAANAGP